MACPPGSAQESPSFRHGERSIDAVDSDAARAVTMPRTHVAAVAGDTRGLHGSLGQRHVAATWKTRQLDAPVLPCFSFLRILNSQIETALQHAFAPGSTRSDTSSTLPQCGSGQAALTLTCRIRLLSSSFVPLQSNK